jgi:hypothetical protein
VNSNTLHLPAAADARAAQDPSTRSAHVVPRGPQEIACGTLSGGQRFAISVVPGGTQRANAAQLLQRMYAHRGYLGVQLPPEGARHAVTLVAHENEQTVGTLTVGFEQQGRLLADELFAEEIDRLRDDGHRVCEFTKLAMDPMLSSKRVLAGIFHVAYLCAHRVEGQDRLVVEVNPRHVAFYRRLLGFAPLGPERWNRRVDAPAVLLGLDLTHARREIARVGGQPERAAVERSLYPHFFAGAQEPLMAERLATARGERPAPAHQGFWSSVLEPLEEALEALVPLAA